MTRVRYVEGKPHWLRISILHSWMRGEVTEESKSKNQIRDDAWRLFDRNPMIERVILVRGRGPLFFLLQDIDGYWNDVTSRQVQLVEE